MPKAFTENRLPELLLAKIDMVLVSVGFGGLLYALVEALVAGVPVIGADVSGIAVTLAPYTSWLVPDDAVGFATATAFSADAFNADLLANYARMAQEPVSDPAVALTRSR